MEIITPEPIENFKNFHFLYRGIHKGLWCKWDEIDKIDPRFFSTKNSVEGLSMDWSKYASSRDTLNRFNEPNLEIWGIIEINYGSLNESIIKNKLPLRVAHDPIPNNRAHTLVHGFNSSNTAKIRRKISKITSWASGMKPIIQ